LKCYILYIFLNFLIDLHKRMGSDESHYLDYNVERVRSLCRTYQVPFTDGKASKCGKRCKILSTKNDYMKVRFQDESEFWFPYQAIRLKRSADRRQGGVDENSSIGSTLISEYHREKTPNWRTKSKATSQKRCPTLNQTFSHYQKQGRDIIRQNHRRVRSFPTPFETRSSGYQNWNSGITSRNTEINERVNKEFPVDSRKHSSGNKFYSSYTRENITVDSTPEVESRPSISSSSHCSPYLSSTAHELQRRSHETNFDLDRSYGHSETHSTALAHQPTGISSQVSSRGSEDQDGMRSLSLGPYRDSGALRLKDFSGCKKFTYPVGFQNLGNTCYMNAAVQCLLNNMMIMAAVELHYQSRIRSEVNSLTREFLSLAKKYTLVGSRPGRWVSPEGIRDAFVDLYPEFEGYCEHDASEFLSYLLGEIGETPIPHDKYRTIDSLFRIHSRIERRYNKRSPVLTSIDSQLLMSLPVVISHKKGSRKIKVELPDLEAAIAYESSYSRQHCEITIKGQRHSSFEQRSTIMASTTPPYLIVHLKRFGVSQGYFNSTQIEKMNVNINVPLRLDLSQFTDNPKIENKYILVGAICHLGKRSSSGHYYSVIKPYEENYWFMADDVYVSEQSSIRPEIKNFYVCFYQKVSS